MTINGCVKGKEGEREVARDLNLIIAGCLAAHGLPQPEKPIVQRNQNQSAVGGSDLTGTFGLAIEIKRQQSLCVPSWWRQCCEQAEQLGEWPVLVYRQNRKPWRVRMLMYTHMSSDLVPSEVDWGTFLKVFTSLVNTHLSAGYRP